MEPGGGAEILAPAAQDSIGVFGARDWLSKHPGVLGWQVLCSLWA